jgi:hypothetical protein
MPRLVTCLFVAFVVTSGCTNTQGSTGQSAPPQTTPTVTRRMQLELEGLVNDYCYRQTVKQTVTRVRCYGNVSLTDIIVYIYPVDDRTARDVVTAMEVDELTAALRKDLKGELLDFPDWAWARAYKITVVDRVKAGK